MVDTHVHAGRHAFKVQSRPDAQTEFRALGRDMWTIDAYDNSERLIYHMDKYGIDVSVIMPAFGMNNEMDKEVMRKYPGRFAAFVSDVVTRRKDAEGVAPWTIDAALEEIERELETGLYVGIGEGLPGDTKKAPPGGWPERFEQICKTMELCRKYKVVATYHCGAVSGYGNGSGGGAKAKEHDRSNVFLAGEVASAYPDVPIILEHAGIEGSGYRTDLYEDCLTVARSNHNLYLETGQWWAELYDKPLRDPNLGCERLVWGTDWGSSIPQSWMPGFVPETFCNQDINVGLPAHQIDIFGWSLRELGRLNIPQDDLNLILGGNACKIMNIKTPVTRLFKEYIKK
jgi:predicted TIM-barrel fold metal-dependent hydrolase